MKTSFKIIIGMVFIILVSGVGVYYGRNALIKKTVETAGPKLLQKSVSLGKVDFQPFRGHVTLQDLHIGNPKGFSSEKELFSLGHISIDLQPETLLSDKIVINSIVIDNVSAFYEIANGTNNIAVIQKNVLGEPKKTSSSSSSVKSNDEKPVKTVVIKDLSVKDATVAAAISGIGVSLPLPAIHMKNIGEEKPSTFKEALLSVLNVFSTETLKAITGASADTVKSGMDSLGKMLKKFF